MKKRKLGSLEVSALGLGCMDGATPGDMSTIGPIDGSADHVRHSIDGSLKRLGVEHVDLYYQHRVDPKMRFDERPRAFLSTALLTFLKAR
jgi:aryl-alcohol dehydrogenase-like predicted oxidoreductase